jgi:hypothetical protein
MFESKVKISDLSSCQSAFISILYFLYCGKVNITHEDES